MIAFGAVLNAVEVAWGRAAKSFVEVKVSMAWTTIRRCERQDETDRTRSTLCKASPEGCFSVYASRTLLDRRKEWIGPKHKLWANPTAAGLPFTLDVVMMRMMMTISALVGTSASCRTRFMARSRRQPHILVRHGTTLNFPTDAAKGQGARGSWVQDLEAFSDYEVEYA